MFRSFVTCIVLALALTATATQAVGQAFGQPFGQQLVGKKCGNCGRSVPLSSQVGDKCPHCGAIWGLQQYQYLGGVPVIGPNNQPSLPFVPQAQPPVVTFERPVEPELEAPQADPEPLHLDLQRLLQWETPRVQFEGTPAARKAAGKIAAYENWIRYDCNFRSGQDIEQARKNFRAVVKMAMAPPRNQTYVRFADLADIEGASFREETGELLIHGPTLTDDDFMPPLLWDDFVVALDIISSGGDPKISIGTPGGRMPTEEERAEMMRTGIIPVLYAPESLSETHPGSVLFEADRWLKTLALGVDNFTGRQVYCPVRGYKSVSARADISLGTQGHWNFGRNWFLPPEPEVSVDAYTMKFIGYKMVVENEIYTRDPAPRDFANQITRDFYAYCRRYPVFRELVRLHKLVEVARWYYESGFPVQPILDNYKPLPVTTMETTKQKRGPTRSQNQGDRIFMMYLTGGVNFSTPNKYIPANRVPAQSLQLGVPAGPLRFQSSVSVAPPRYGSFVGPAPVPNHIVRLVNARPTPATMNWRVTVGTKTIRVALMPVGVAGEKTETRVRDEVGPYYGY